MKMNVALPPRENWNRIYLARQRRLGSRTSAAAVNEALLGYATSHNDLGTEDWQNNPDLKSVVADFGHRAIYNTRSVSRN